MSVIDFAEFHEIQIIPLIMAPAMYIEIIFKKTLKRFLLGFLAIAVRYNAFL